QAAQAVRGAHQAQEDGRGVEPGAGELRTGTARRCACRPTASGPLHRSRENSVLAVCPRPVLPQYDRRFQIERRIDCRVHPRGPERASDGARRLDSAGAIEDVAGIRLAAGVAEEYDVESAVTQAPGRVAGETRAPRAVQ